MTTKDTVFVLVDVQEKLFPFMDGHDRLADRLVRLVRGLALLEVPIVWVEQIPEKMGATIPELREALGDRTPIAKVSFSCCGEEAFVRELRACGREHVLLAGIETHVCVYQTAMHLRQDDYHVDIVADAVSSRTAVDRQIGLARAHDMGAGLTSVETALFELMGTSKHPAFREMLKLVK